MRYYESAGILFNPELRQYIMCNCWHHGDEESMAMWDKYHLRNSGIAIKTTMGNLKRSLPQNEPNIFIDDILPQLKQGGFLPYRVRFLG